MTTIHEKLDDKIAVGEGSTIIEELRASATYRRNYIAQDLAAWAERFAKYPASALGSNDVFQEAARLEVVDQFLAWTDIENREFDEKFASMSRHELALAVLNDVRREFMDELFRRAKWPEHSTSSASNETSVQRNAARAEMIETIDGAIAARNHK